MSPYQQWCAERGVDHAHCPFCSPLCEHPQPYRAADGRLLCGRCAFQGETTEMVACTPETCEE